MFRLMFMRWRKRAKGKVSAKLKRSFAKTGEGVPQRSLLRQMSTGCLTPEAQQSPFAASRNLLLEHF